MSVANSVSAGRGCRDGRWALLLLTLTDGYIARRGFNGISTGVDDGELFLVAVVGCDSTCCGWNVGGRDDGN